MRPARSRLALVVGLTLWAVCTAPALAAPVEGRDVTYTLDADFDKGTAVNVNHEAVHDQLQLNTETSTFPFVWVALSRRCTIAKINTEDGKILGEYSTISDEAPRGCNESSRTTVGLDGSVWVGHRGPGGVTHVGLAELNQCVDRNSNGTIETSSGYGDVRPWTGPNTSAAGAADECILHHVDTDALSFSDTRHMSIDADNKLWVGDRGRSQFVRINGSTGAIETAPRSFACGGYGGLIDGAGVIWSATSGSTLLRWDPNAADGDTNPRCIQVGNFNYGMAVDGDGWIWTTTFGAEVYKTSPDGNTILGPFLHGAQNSQGLAVAPNGDVWVSSSLNCNSGCTIGHLKNDGTYVGSVPNPTGAGSTGVSVDSAGRIWSANRSSSTATRIDPNGGPIGADGVTRVGAVDLTVEFPAGPGDLPSPSPYNYSDMTGSQLLAATSPQGSWTVTQDGGTAGLKWTKAIWNGSVPSGGSLLVEVRAADTEAALGSAEYVAVESDRDFSVTGRFIQVRVTFKPGAEGASPVLTDIRVCDAGGCKPAPQQQQQQQQPAAAGGVLGASSRSCVSRRSFRIRVRKPKGAARIRDARVFVNGKRVRVIRGDRFRSRVNLRGLPKGRFTVRIVVRTVDGRSYTGTRRYRTCVGRTGAGTIPRI